MSHGLQNGQMKILKSNKFFFHAWIFYELSVKCLNPFEGNENLNKIFLSLELNNCGIIFNEFEKEKYAKFPIAYKEGISICSPYMAEAGRK